MALELAQPDNVPPPKLHDVHHSTIQTLRVVDAEIVSPCAKATTGPKIDATLVLPALQTSMRAHPLPARAVRTEPTHQLVPMATRARFSLGPQRWLHVTILVAPSACKCNHTCFVTCVTSLSLTCSLAGALAQTTIVMHPLRVTHALWAQKHVALPMLHTLRQVPRIYRTLEAQTKRSTTVAQLRAREPPSTLNVFHVLPEGLIRTAIRERAALVHWALKTYARLQAVSALPVPVILGTTITVP
jgi:hypothetical protein